MIENEDFLSKIQGTLDIVEEMMKSANERKSGLLFWNVGNRQSFPYFNTINGSITKNRISNISCTYGMLPVHLELIRTNRFIQDLKLLAGIRLRYSFQKQNL